MTSVIMEITKIPDIEDLPLALVWWDRLHAVEKEYVKNLMVNWYAEDKITLTFKNKSLEILALYEFIHTKSWRLVNGKWIGSCP